MLRRTGMVAGTDSQSHHHLTLPDGKRIVNLFRSGYVSGCHCVEITARYADIQTVPDRETGVLAHELILTSRDSILQPFRRHSRILLDGGTQT